MSLRHLVRTTNALKSPTIRLASHSAVPNPLSRHRIPLPHPQRPARVLYQNSSSINCFSSSSSSSPKSRWQRFTLFATSKLNSSLFPSTSSSKTDPSSDSDETGTHTSEPKIEFSRLLDVAKRERMLIGFALGAQLLSSSAMLLFPLAMGNIVDTVSGSNNSLTDLTKLVGLMGGVFVVSGVATAARVSTMSLAGSRISRDLRVRLFRALLNQDTAFFDVRQTGELINRLSNDVPQVSRTLTENLAKVLRSGVMSASSLGMIIYLSPKLAFITSLSIPPIALFASIFGRNARRLSRSLVDALAAATQVAAERTSAIRTVRIFGAELLEANRYAKRVDDTYGLSKKVALADGIYAGSVQLAAQMSLLGVLWFGGRMVLDPLNPMTIGALTSFSMYAVNLGVSVAGVGTAYGQLTRALGSAFRIFEVIDRQPRGPSSTLAQQTEDLMTLKRHRSDSGSDWIEHINNDATVQFHNISFTYPTRPQSEVLSGVDLTIRPGEIIGIAGSSGSGKSTISSLLTRLYEPTSGHITLGDVPIDSLKTYELRKLVSVVAQEPVLFSGTITENIRYGTSEQFEEEESESSQQLSMSEVIQAAKDAASHDMITSLPMGYDTQVGERGSGLSGGQRARVALARALARQPKVLVLDEHSAALDAESERAVAQAVHHAARDMNIAVISIAHRSSSLKRADRIAVLGDGSVKEIDSFDNLMANPNSVLRKMLVPTDNDADDSSQAEQRDASDKTVSQ